MVPTVQDKRDQLTVASASYDTVVQTIAGAPTTLLGDSCGRIDSLPPQEAMFATPTGVASYVNASLETTRDIYSTTQIGIIMPCVQ